MIPAIHAVTNDDIILRPDFLEQARMVMSALGPMGALQLRAPNSGGWTLSGLVRALAPTQASTGAWLVVNERIDVALAAGARAVQLTRRSVALADARKVAPDLVIGASIHSLAEGVEAGDGGAAWGVIARATALDGGRAASGAPLLDALRQRTALPLVVIGNVRPADVASLRARGAHGIAAIRGIWDARNAERAAIDYLTAYEAADGARDDRS